MKLLMHGASPKGTYDLRGARLPVDLSIAFPNWEGMTEAGKELIIRAIARELNYQAIGREPNVAFDRCWAYIEKLTAPTRMVGNMKEK